MYRDIEIIESTIWQHVNGRQASIYGASPWTSEADRQNWSQITRGYTWRCTHNDGSVTIGMCRKPAKTYEEAEEIRRKFLSV